MADAKSRAVSTSTLPKMLIQKARAPSMAMGIFRHWNLECYSDRGFHPGALRECPEPEAALQLRRQGDAA
jgi:hypothetical protein